jgi:hypothetical protein
MLKEQEYKNDDKNKEKDASAGHSDSFGIRMLAAIGKPNRPAPE